MPLMETVGVVTGVTLLPLRIATRSSNTGRQDIVSCFYFEEVTTVTQQGAAQWRCRENVVVVVLFEALPLSLGKN